MSKPELTEEDFRACANDLMVPVAAIKAVCEVEAPRGGFNPDGTPVTLFEAHVFSRETGGRYDLIAPDVSSPRWNRRLYGKTWQQEKARLDRAAKLDRDAALRACSWGRFQIMGFNHDIVGFEAIQEFVNAMYESEAEHLRAFGRFLIFQGLCPALRRLDWATFARGYNGPGYRENRYDEKLARAYEGALV